MNKYYRSYKDLEDAVKVGGTVANGEEILKNFKTLVYRSIPMEPENFKEEWGNVCCCGYCESELTGEESYCPDCGQAIDWEEHEEEKDFEYNDYPEEETDREREVLGNV